MRTGSSQDFHPFRDDRFVSCGMDAHIKIWSFKRTPLPTPHLMERHACFLPHDPSMYDWRSCASYIQPIFLGGGQIE